LGGGLVWKCILTCDDKGCSSSRISWIETHFGKIVTQWSRTVVQLDDENLVSVMAVAERRACLSWSRTR
jgi:hypothetical protein